MSYTMPWHDHHALNGKHAELSPSSYHWLNYDEQKLVQVHDNLLAKKRGTKLHDFADKAISMGIKLRGRNTLALHVNDALGYRMKSEQPLYYSDYCFGTADAISFDGKTLRIHDLKTGDTPAHMEQLRIYAALFCLEYDISPSDIAIELRIYQFDKAFIEKPDPAEIDRICEIIIAYSDLLSQVDYEGQQC